MVIERMEGLACLEHHEVGHVHDIVDAADADLFERRAQPIGTRTDLHPAHDPGDVARTQVRVFDAHGHQIFSSRF